MTKEIKKITKRERLEKLINSAGEMYADNFKGRVPAGDYLFYVQEVTQEYYEISAQRIKGTLDIELNYQLSEYIKVADIENVETQYHIRNKVYCFIHYIYEFHWAEKYGRDKLEAKYEKMRNKKKSKKAK